MFLTKLKIVVGVALVVVALGAGGVAYRSADAQTVQPPRRAEGKPLSEVEALRKEVELLRLNLLLVLEKVRAQEAELSAFRGQRGATATDLRVRVWDLAANSSSSAPKTTTPGQPGHGSTKTPSGGRGANQYRATSDAALHAEAGLKAMLRDAKDDTARRQLLDAMERMVRRLREEQGGTSPQHDPFLQRR
jgi:hypothetical protein